MPSYRLFRIPFLVAALMAFILILASACSSSSDSDELERIHQGMVSMLDQRGVTVRGVYVSPHHWDEEAFDRKPNPGLFYRVSQELGFRLDRVVYVGDDIRDCKAAANAGCGMVYITSEGEDGQMPVSRMPQWTVRTFCEAMPVIREFYEGFER